MLLQTILFIFFLSDLINDYINLFFRNNATNHECSPNVKLSEVSEELAFALDQYWWGYVG